MTSEALPNQRLVQLLEQLTEEYIRDNQGKEHGSHVWVAKTTGLSKSNVIKLLSGERDNSTIDRVEGVRQKMRLRWDFFVDEVPRHYKEAQRKTEEQLPPAFIAFREVYSRFGELSERQVEQLEEMVFRNGPPNDPGPYVTVAETMLKGGGERSARMVEAESEAERQGVKKIR